LASQEQERKEKNTVTQSPLGLIGFPIDVDEIEKEVVVPAREGFSSPSNVHPPKKERDY
jgi:hypothetical protein